MPLVGLEGPPGRSMLVWNIVCLGDTYSEWLHYCGVEIPEYFGNKGVLFISVTK